MGFNSAFKGLNEDLCTFMKIFWLIFFRIITVSDKCFRENHNTFNGR